MHVHASCYMLHATCYMPITTHTSFLLWIKRLVMVGVCVCVCVLRRNWVYVIELIWCRFHYRSYGVDFIM
jgi:hypothetical protein